MENCKKCGIPETMYWCDKCEANCESEKCEQCGEIINLDSLYHENCGYLTKEINVNIFSGFQGSKPEIRITIGKESFVMDKEYLEAFIAETMESRGFTVEKKTRQRYGRIILNK